MEFLDVIRILGGGALWLIVLCLTFVLWRVWHLMRAGQVNGMVKMLFHITLAGNMYVFWGAFGSITGLYLGQYQGYVTFRILWWFVAVLWLLGAILYALMCITRELYDQRRNAINSPDGQPD